MKYLFFDLEYASSRDGVCKICEFGYTQTNEKFEVIKRGNLIINPNITRPEWDWRVVKKILTRKVFEYERSNTFDDFYPEIVELIKDSDYVFGHSLDGDVNALNDECKRYKLPSIDFNFFEVKRYYINYTKVDRDVSVANMLKELEIEGDINLHDAEADAYNTMLILKTILERKEYTLEQLMEKCPKAKDSNNDYKVKSIVEHEELKRQRCKHNETRQ